MSEARAAARGSVEVEASAADGSDPGGDDEPAPRDAGPADRDSKAGGDEAGRTIGCRAGRAGGAA
ncbi:MAG TPA: hypothetical protein RMH99_03800, partial [Sandaracinaceae bacterium LLY-WYZ-13_1]|nr:hypothetical protein [Sandaracinaceae bacterium LLY-WYZ-13_1]